MTSVPLTPKTPRTRQSGFRTAATTPRHLKKTIMNLDPNLSYIEEEDYLYVNDTTGASYSEIDADETLEDADLLEASLSDDDAAAPEPTAAERELFATDSPVLAEPTAAERELFAADALDSVADAATPPVGAVKAFIIKHEVIRKALHSSIGVFTLWLYTLGVHQTQLIVPLSVLFAAIFANDFVRFRNPELNQRIVSQFWFLIRDQERNQYNGTLYFLVGLVIVFSLFPKDISLMSVLLLSWADTAALTVGRQWGKYTPKIAKGKSVAGSLASLVAGVVSCYVLYGYFLPVYNHVNEPRDIMWTASTSRLSLPVYALFSGVIASVSEFIDIGGIDDNFTIPVLSGAFLYVLVKVCQV